MKCPVCKNSKHRTEMDVHDNGFDEDIFECEVYGTTWSVNHGVLEVIKDSQAQSFLEATTECVDGDDYNRSSA